MRTSWLRCLPIVACCVFFAEESPAETQSFPWKPIKIVIAGGPGGPNEIVARLASDILSRLGQPAIVEHLPGAGGAIGARAVAAAPADGHTLLIGNTATLAVIPAVSSHAGYDPTKSFVPVAKFWEGYQVVVVSPSLAATTMGEFITLAKAQPGKLNYAHGTTGGLPHLAGELFKLRANVDLVGVPYRSEPEFMTAAMTGTVQMAFPSMEAALPLIREGKLRGLGVTAPTRAPSAPELPTVIEEGVPDYEVTTFFGIVAPAGTPDSTIRILNAALNKGLSTEETRAIIAKLGVVSKPGSPQEFAGFIADKWKKWDAVVKQAGIKID
jgi:tripartite-type tricarboxylate transporter receptor subunit TctC